SANVEPGESLTRPGGARGSATPSVPVDEPSSLLPPLVLGGAGVVVLGSALAFYLLRNGSVDDVHTLCGGSASECDPSMLDAAQSPYSTAQTYNTLTNVGLALGSTAVVAALTWLLLGGPWGDDANDSSEGSVTRRATPSRVTF